MRCHLALKMSYFLFCDQHSGFFNGCLCLAEPDRFSDANTVSLHAQNRWPKW